MRITDSLNVVRTALCPRLQYQSLKCLKYYHSELRGSTGLLTLSILTVNYFQNLNTIHPGMNTEIWEGY